MSRLRFLGLVVLPLVLAPSLQAADSDVQSLARRIDERIKAAWSPGVKPAARADDAEFFRRLNLDLAGRIPVVTEARDFLDDDRPDKRPDSGPSAFSHPAPMTSRTRMPIPITSPMSGGRGCWRGPASRIPFPSRSWKPG